MSLGHGATAILLVEDNPLDALLLTEQRAHDQHLRPAESLADAVRHIQSAPPDGRSSTSRFPTGAEPG